VRRWFVECTAQRRATLMQCGLVSQRKGMETKGNLTTPNIFTIARRMDKAMWVEGVRNEPRLSWLSAPESAYKAARKHNADMQNSTCNWAAAYALREEVTNSQPVFTLMTVPSLSKVVKHGLM
jgi:hypothetical protein